MALVFSVSSLGITVFYSKCNASGKLTVSISSPKSCCGKITGPGFSKSCCEVNVQHLKVAPMRIPASEMKSGLLASLQVFPPIPQTWLIAPSQARASFAASDPPDWPPTPVGRAAQQHFCRYLI
jgi:hypothetical protein